MQNRLAPMVEMGTANNDSRTAMPFVWIKPDANAMTTQDKLQAIREKCVEANPEIKSEESAPCPDRQIGCIVCHFKVTYRPITLADVLLAWQAHSERGWHDTDGFLEEIVSVWNLRTDDLSRQDEPTIDFIHSVLYPNESD